MAQELETKCRREAGKRSGGKGEEHFIPLSRISNFPDDTRPLDELREKGDCEGLLTLDQKEYYDGNGIGEQHTYLSATNNKGDSPNCRG